MTEEETKILNHHRRQCFQDELRHLHTRQGAFDAAFLHFDHPLPGCNCRLEPSDNGKSAALIRSNCEETPLWRKLWAKAHGNLTRKQKRILNALLIDFSTTNAARIARVERTEVWRFKKTFFKMHFDQCHTAWKRNFA